MKKLKNQQKRLKLHRETVQELQSKQLEQAFGGAEEISGSYPFCAP